MANEFEGMGDTPDQPARNASPVVPHATNPLVNVSKAIYVGGAGNIVCRLIDDTADVTFEGLGAGALLPIRVSHVRATGTTATKIVALY